MTSKFCYLHPVALVPNCLITDATIQYSTKVVATVLLFLSGRKNRAVRVTYAMLAKLAHCSPTTAQNAIRELSERGYILRQRKYRFDSDRGHLVYDANAYVWVRRQGGYTMLKREILDYDLSPAAFSNLLYLYRCAGQKGRAFPSLRRIAGLFKDLGKLGLDMAKSTVCAALKALRCLQAIVRHRCLTKPGCHTCNSYYLTDMVIAAPVGAVCIGGSPKSDKPIIINQLTGVFTEREEKYGVAQFGSLPKFDRDFSWVSPCWFDGTGVKVSVCDELELIS